MKPTGRSKNFKYLKIAREYSCLIKSQKALVVEWKGELAYSRDSEKMPIKAYCLISNPDYQHYPIIVFDIQQVTFIDDICREELISALRELSAKGFGTILINRRKVFDKLGEEIRGRGTAVVNRKQFAASLSVFA